MARRDVVVIGGSAGSGPALNALVSRLPADLSAALLVVTHMPSSSSGHQGRILSRHGHLPARMAVNGERLHRGTIYLPIPDHHLLVGIAAHTTDDYEEGPDGSDDRLLDETADVRYGPKENQVRPAIDPLFRSAARKCGARVIGVALSGALDDGAAGVAAIIGHGGTVLVQDPAEARFAGIPRAALNAAGEATVCRADELGPLIAELVGTLAMDARASSLEGGDVTEGIPHPVDRSSGAEPTLQLGCPDCGGGLEVVHAGNTVRYHCHVGHSYGPRTLAEAKSVSVEAALWTAVSALQEQAAIYRQLAAEAGRREQVDEEKQYLEAAQHALASMKTIRQQYLRKRSPTL